MMTELCAYLRNYFLRDYSRPDDSIHHGTFTVERGSVQNLSFLLPGQYFRIIGSVFNDGVWVYDPDVNNTDLIDETFNGSIWAMNVPHAVIALNRDIDAWVAANAAAINSPYRSESFGGYSYTRKSGSAGGVQSDSYGWQDQFAARLAPYRRLSVL